MCLPRESFQILPPLFHEMTEVGHILAKFEGGYSVSLQPFLRPFQCQSLNALRRIKKYREKLEISFRREDFAQLRNMVGFKFFY